MTFSAQDDEQSNTESSTLALVPAVLGNLSYSTHSWSSPHVIPHRWDQDKPYFAAFPPTVSIKKRFEVEKHISPQTHGS